MNKIDQLISCITKEEVFIQTHNFPDPDAIASAYGMMLLLESKGIKATICHKGKIDSYSTSQIVSELQIEMVEIEELEKENRLNEESEIIIVDSQKGNGNVIDLIGNEIACIDHHPTFLDKYRNYRYEDIRPEYGACSTIIYEYLKENHIVPDRTLATVFSYAIRQDTKLLSRGVSRMDIQALADLFEQADYQLIYKLENSTIYYEDLKSYAKAIKSTEIYGNISFAEAGKNCPECLIASICDFMMTMVETEFAIVYSLKKDGIKISVRSESPKLHAGFITNEALCGIGSGGGHASMAGGFIPFDTKRGNTADLILEMKHQFIEIVHRSGFIKMVQEDYIGNKKAEESEA